MSLAEFNRVAPAPQPGAGKVLKQSEAPDWHKLDLNHSADP